MSKDEAYDLAIKIVLLHNRLKPFPYVGARKILRRHPNKYETLIPDLDWFESTIAGFSSHAEDILGWTHSQIEQAQPLLSRSFYEAHPSYMPLQESINDFTDLNEDIQAHEEMRQSLLLLLAHRLHQLPHE